MVNQQPPPAKPCSRTRLIVQTTVSLALVVAIFYYLLKGSDLALVWAEIRAMSWTEDAVLALIGAWNLATYAFVWMSVTPGLSFGRAMVMTQSATAVTNTVPTVGPAIGVGLTWLVDFDRAEAAASQAPLDHDAAALLAALDGVADPALVRATAEQALGQDTMARVLPPAAATPAAAAHAAQGS